jgi:hypothetical protein
MPREASGELRIELDHLFCMVEEPKRAARRLEEAGWALDEGRAHAGQGTRNRRLRWPELFFELLWVSDLAEAEANPVRLDRRAAWRTTGASPLGIAFRGMLAPADAERFWPYDLLGPRIWIHRDNETAPERPLVFVVEVERRMASAEQVEQPGLLHAVRLHGPSQPWLPAFAGPPVSFGRGAHRLELVTDARGADVNVEDVLTIRA